jgi:uncharacterized protein (TIGR00369 family)
VPFVKAGRLRVLVLNQRSVELELPMSRRVQNHIGTVHAVAAVLLAETAGGLAFALALPAGRVPVVKSLSMDYQRKFKGKLNATARVRPEDALRMRAEERGELAIEICLRDETGLNPALCQFIYAWHPPRLPLEKRSVVGRPS